jgi:hypothetical protein
MLSVLDKLASNILTNTPRLQEQGECMELMGEEATVFIKHFYIIYDCTIFIEIPTRNDLEFSLSGILYLYASASYLF